MRGRHIWRPVRAGSGAGGRISPPGCSSGPTCWRPGATAAPAARPAPRRPAPGRCRSARAQRSKARVARLRQCAAALNLISDHTARAGCCTRLVSASYEAVRQSRVGRLASARTCPPYATDAELPARKRATASGCRPSGHSPSFYPASPLPAPAAPPARASIRPAPQPPSRCLARALCGTTPRTFPAQLGRQQA